MEIKGNENEQWGSFITGLSYSGILAIILLLICLIISDSLFDNPLTFIIIGLVCIVFFGSGLKKVDEKNLAFIRKLGKRDFTQYYSEGWWWIFPFWSFKQKAHFNILNEGEPIQLNFITNDKIPLEIHIKYFWQLKNPEKVDNMYSTAYIKSVLEFELGKFVRSGNAIELLSDVEVSKKVMVNYLETACEKIGITISDVFPNINYESQYTPVVRKLQKDYTELQFELDKLLRLQTVKVSDMQIYQNQIQNFVKELGFSNSEVLNFIKVYKNHVNLNEQTYNLNLGDLNNVIDTLMNFFKR